MPLEDVDEAISRLCRACGFCCNGVLFTQVPLSDVDDLSRLTAPTLLPHEEDTASGQRGLSDAFLHYDSEAARTLEQPCSFLADKGCSIYCDRPTRCREYECRLIAGMRRAEFSLEFAERIITKATELYSLLQEELGTTNGKTGSWSHRRRLVRQSVFSSPSMSHKVGIDHNTMLRLQEFVGILDSYFETTPVHFN